MNTSQYSTYFKNAFDEIDKATDGKSYRDIELLGNSASTLAANLMQKEENELAYKRSSASNQVNLMRAAGMSRAGAINALNGGGSYTPAPVQVASTGTDAQNVRAQDMNNLFSALESLSANTTQMAQLQEQKRQFNMQHAESKRQFDITHAETKRMNDDALKTSSEQRRLLGVEINGKSIANELLSIEREISAATKDGRIDTEKLENVARQAQAILDKFKTDKVYNVMQDMSDEDLEGLFQMQAWLNLIEQGIQSKVPKMVMHGAEKLSNFLLKLGIK